MTTAALVVMSMLGGMGLGFIWGASWYRAERDRWEKAESIRRLDRSLE